MHAAASQGTISRKVGRIVAAALRTDASGL